mgnify:CR=1 FL=1
MVINELPVGSVVRLGRYALGHRPDDMIDIDWIKVSKNNDFISQKVLLGIQYDARENWDENYDYSLSNIRQFMNSENHAWYHPTHPNDRGPDYVMLDNYITINTGRYSGFLSHFQDAEISALELVNDDYMRLPTVSEIMGGFQYFKRYGKRAHPVNEFGCLSLNNYREGMYYRYYMIDNLSPINYLAEMGRDGNYSVISPVNYSGLRPVCKIKAGAAVEQTGKNTYKMNISSTGPVKFFKETQSIDWLLGL